MSIEIGSLVVRGSFGRGQGDSDDAVNEDRLRDVLEALRRDLREEVARAAERIERRLRES
ncbi:hypothetical protein [Roseovarius aestuarii]|uniref:Uncharacterized protein n=1 Tax=Roseovarius aestuarii TaxID=475083 RepID=A0A1X7BMA6_9RHOB|nr:hypothetical protein [Roseovarius aestuarii]SMC10664.1 hypothetical protein ROA7745_00471 [Roseovarius aestuarii]